MKIAGRNSHITPPEECGEVLYNPPGTGGCDGAVVSGGEAWYLSSSMDDIVLEGKTAPPYRPYRPREDQGKVARAL
jgi:hypothetical protein